MLEAGTDEMDKMTTACLKRYHISEETVCIAI